MKYRIKLIGQVLGLGLVVLLTSRIEAAPQQNKSVHVIYNGFETVTLTEASDVAELLVTSFGGYDGLVIDPDPASELTDGMTVSVNDPAVTRLNKTVSKNYQTRQVEITKAETPPPKPKPKPKPSDIHSGLATWYRFGDKLTTASREYPKGTKLRVVAVNSGKSVDVVVNDYGPAVNTGIELDLNAPAFEAIAPLGAGKIKVKYYKI